MIRRLLLYVTAGALGLWFTTEILSNVSFHGTLEELLATGAILGFLNATAKLILNILTLPLKFLTLGLSGLLINILIVFAVDIVFRSLDIVGIVALFNTTVIVWALTLLFLLFLKSKV